MKKKFFTLALSALALTSMFVSCSESNNDPEPNANYAITLDLPLNQQNGTLSDTKATLTNVQTKQQYPANSFNKNGNVYVARGYTHFLLENGTMTNGQRYDEVLYTDKIAEDLQNAAVTLLADNPDKMPQTDDSTAQFINRFSSILMGYTDRGVLASAVWRGADAGPLRNGEIVENGFMFWADSYDDQSEADRAAHRAVPVQCALCLAGSIENLIITVNVMI